MPPGCALGTRGPTIRLFDSVRWAAEEARANLASSLLGVSIKNIFVITGDTFKEVSLERVKGVLSDVIIVAQWIDRGGQISEPGTSYALACTRQAARTIRISGNAPDWVLNVPTDRICAIGTCGTTIRPEDQHIYVLEDARERLAESISVHIEAARSYGVPGINIGGLETIPDYALERAASGTIREKWLDEKGEGPLQEPSTLYALICVD